MMNVKKIYGNLLMAIMRGAGKDAAKKFDVLLRYRKRLNLKKPVSLRDKVIYIENHCPERLAAMCTDKWAVRDYVAAKGYADTLVPVHGGAWTRVEDIPFDTLPDRFVLKAAHGCKMNYFCTGKSSFDEANCRQTLRRWLRTTYGRYSGEWHYFDIPHRIYCEQYLDDADKMVDYKFHCMNGIPQFILVCGSRRVGEIGNEVSRSLYDMDWQPMAGLTDTEMGAPTPRPSQLDAMIEMAKALSADFRFVRVDLYEIEGKVYFGELTFTPTGGVFSHYTDDFLTQMGERLTLDLREA